MAGAPRQKQKREVRCNQKDEDRNPSRRTLQRAAQRVQRIHGILQETEV